jgi:hypothetical protein
VTVSTSPLPDVKSGLLNASSGLQAPLTGGNPALPPIAQSSQDPNLALPPVQATNQVGQGVAAAVDVGVTSNSPIALAVPEPSSLILIVFACGAYLGGFARPKRRG